MARWRNCRLWAAGGHLPGRVGLPDVLDPPRLPSPGLWKYHAVHHSSEELDWISAARFHPVNIFLGSVRVPTWRCCSPAFRPTCWCCSAPSPSRIRPSCTPISNWTLGPFKYVIAGPVFHRWHHTAADRGGDKNFAATFPVLDLLFGTFYMPPSRCPTPMASTNKFPGELRRPDAVSFPTLIFFLVLQRPGPPLCTSFTNLQST